MNVNLNLYPMEYPIHELVQPLPSKIRVAPITTIVLHATAGSNVEGAITTLRSRQLSYHYIIDKNGHIIKCCPANNVAYHAGESWGPDGRYVNKYSIGIAFVNLNDGKDTYTLEQHEACQYLCHMLMLNIPTIKWITTHYSISPGRKTDPINYPIGKLAKKLELDIWSGK